MPHDSAWQPTTSGNGVLYKGTNLGELVACDGGFGGPPPSTPGALVPYRLGAS